MYNTIIAMWRDQYEILKNTGHQYWTKLYE